MPPPPQSQPPAPAPSEDSARPGRPGWPTPRPEELADALDVRLTPATEQVLTDCLEAAATEIDHCLDDVAITNPPPAIVVRTNVNRAVEWYKAPATYNGGVGFADSGRAGRPNLGLRAPRRRPAPVADRVGAWRNGAQPAARGAREKLAAVLAPLRELRPHAVLTSLVDALEPPALMLGWGDPMLRAERSDCFATGRLLVTAVASRLVPGEGVGVLEGLVDYTLRRTFADTGENWELVDASGPRELLHRKDALHWPVRIILNVTITQ